MITSAETHPKLAARDIINIKNLPMVCVFITPILEAMPKNATYPVRFRETKPAIADWPY